MIYKYLLEGNERFGIKPIDICRSTLECEPEDISEDVILAPWWQPDIFEEYVDSIFPVAESVNKLWTITVNEKKITYIRTGIGAPVVIDDVLALGCTPCRNIIFIGSVGGLDEKLKIGDLVIPEYSFCGDGACRYLTDGNIGGNDCFGEKYYPDRNLYEKIKETAEKIGGKNNVDWHTGKTFSLDTVVAQFAHIDEILRMGCNCIEMETAVFFKASEICNIKSAAIFSVSDNTITKKSLLAGRTKEEMDHRRYVRKNILTKIVLECFREPI